MILIADSGSTKTDWCFIKDTGEMIFINTPGINPFFWSSDDIVEELEHSLFSVTGRMINNIYFYGAGVTDPVKGETVKTALRKLYPVAEIETESDLLASARATCGSDPGIACILGTGSNSCYYDGERIADQISPLGFILGDEGSGAVMGRKLVGDYLKKIMPPDLRNEFSKNFPITPAEILEKVYRKPRPNSFLAGFTRFLSAHIGHAYCYHFVKMNFREFIERNVLSYQLAKQLKIHFTGSLGFFFSDILKEVLKEADLLSGIILKEPMEGLIRFHTSK